MGCSHPKEQNLTLHSLVMFLCGSGGTTPYTIRTPAKTDILLALTLIDPATGWFEFVEAKKRSATFIQDLFHNTWLARYPRPQFIVFDNARP
jgi:hypothetical protein